MRTYVTIPPFTLSPAPRPRSLSRVAVPDVTAHLSRHKCSRARVRAHTPTCTRGALTLLCHTWHFSSIHVPFFSLNILPANYYFMCYLNVSVLVSERETQEKGGWGGGSGKDERREEKEGRMSSSSKWKGNILWVFCLNECIHA